MRVPPVERATGEQGFVTSTRRFVDRREAFEIASAAGQIVKKHGDESQLYSEDLY